MATLRQTSFGAGELSPLLWGRSDLDLFAHGARRLRDFVVSPQGPAVSRPGTFRIGEAKTKEVVLLPLLGPNGAAYVLELGQSYLRVHDPENGYLGIELVTPYLAEHLHELQWAQVGNVLTITHPSYPPREVVVPTAFPFIWQTRLCTFEPPVTAYFLKKDGSRAPVPHLTPGFTAPGVTRPTSNLFFLDAAHAPKEWRWKVSANLRNMDTGQQVETLPIDVVEYSDGVTTASRQPIPNDNLVVLAADVAVVLNFPSFATPLPAPSSGRWEFLGVNWYRGRGPLFGHLATTRWAQSFVDTGTEPNYARQPLRAENPFADYFPAAVAFFQQRRLFAGDNTLWASATDAWEVFDRPFPPYLIADGPITASFLSRRRETIRSLVQHNRLLAFTDVSVWSVEYQPGTEALPSLFGFALEDEVGSTKLQPLVVDGAVLYVRAKGRGVRALLLADNGHYATTDISDHAEHFFREPGDEIVSWCFQRDPWAIIWAAQSDGGLLSCTRTSRGWAWAKHTMTGGTVRSVTTVPATRADMVFAAVTRGDTTYIERLTQRDRLTLSPITTDVGEGSIAVDCASSHVVPLAATTVITGLSRFEGRDVWGIAPGNAPQGPLRVTGGQVTVGPWQTANRTAGNVLVVIGLPFTPELQTLDAGGLQQKLVTKVGFEVDQAQGLQAGQDFEHLVPWRQRDVRDSYDFPGAASELVVVSAPGAWRKHGRAVLRQSLPQPVTVLGITREIDVGGT